MKHVILLAALTLLVGCGQTSDEAAESAMLFLVVVFGIPCAIMLIGELLDNNKPR